MEPSPTPETSTSRTCRESLCFLPYHVMCSDVMSYKMPRQYLFLCYCSPPHPVLCTRTCSFYIFPLAFKAIFTSSTCTAHPFFPCAQTNATITGYTLLANSLLITASLHTALFLVLVTTTIFLEHFIFSTHVHCSLTKFHAANFCST